MRALKAHNSEASDDIHAVPASSGALKRGDKVRVIRRMTWAVPHPERAEYNHNVQVGREGIIEGFADDTQSKVLLSLELNLEGGPQMVTRPCYPRNVALVASEVPAAADPPSEEPPAKRLRHKKRRLG